MIVNKGDSGSSVVNTSLYNDEAFSETQVDNFLSEELEGTSEEIVVQATPGYCVKKDFLEKILEYKKVLVIETGEITYRIDGNLVRNAEKEFIAQINMKNIPEGLQFEINKGDELPGTIEISLGNIEEKYQYLYLFNEHAGKYEKLNSYDDGVLVVNKGGTYLLAEDEIIEHKNLKNVLGISAVAVGGLFVIYVVVKKKYWFW